MCVRIFCSASTPKFWLRDLIKDFVMAFEYNLDYIIPTSELYSSTYINVLLQLNAYMGSSLCSRTGKFSLWRECSSAIYGSACSEERYSGPTSWNPQHLLASITVFFHADKQRQCLSFRVLQSHQIVICYGSDRQIPCSTLCTDEPSSYRGSVLRLLVTEIGMKFVGFSTVQIIPN